jgi:hypothetical protein
MPFLPGIYFIDQVISLHTEHVLIPIGIFSNLKSLSIVHGDSPDEEYLNMINEVRLLYEYEMNKILFLIRKRKHREASDGI